MKKYLEIPIFINIEAEKFMNIFVQTKFDNQQICFAAIKNRYNSEENNHNLLQELDWLKSMQNLLREEIESRTGKPSGLLLKHLNKEFLNQGIESL